MEDLVPDAFDPLSWPTVPHPMRLCSQAVSWGVFSSRRGEIKIARHLKPRNLDGAPAQQSAQWTFQPRSLSDNWAPRKALRATRRGAWPRSYHSCPPGRRKAPGQDEPCSPFQWAFRTLRGHPDGRRGSRPGGRKLKVRRQLLPFIPSDECFSDPCNLHDGGLALLSALFARFR